MNIKSSVLLETLRWEDHPANPIIEPPSPEWMIADPTLLTPDDSPDQLWHMFANSLLGIHHYISSDGIKWTKQGKRLFGGLRPYVYKEHDHYFILYEKAISPRRTVIAMRKSEDLIHWSDPTILIGPYLYWEGKGLCTNGNPCLIFYEGLFRLYYSAGWVFLRDCLFIEPKYIGVAVSESIFGPYYKRFTPLIGPSKDPYFRNLGAGAIKIIPPKGNGKWYGLNNGIYRDEKGKSRSAIFLLNSENGYQWNIALKNPILAPSDTGWKRALVYALDIVEYNNELRIYYNARDGWFKGRERIGVAFAGLT